MSVVTPKRSLPRLLPVALLACLVASTLAPAALANHTDTSPVRIDALSATATISNHYAVTAVAETLTNPADTAYEFTATIAAPELRTFHPALRPTLRAPIARDLADELRRRRLRRPRIRLPKRNA